MQRATRAGLVNRRGIPRGTAAALTELVWCLLWVNVFVVVAGALVGRRLESITLGIMAYLGAGLVVSAMVLMIFAANVLAASALERWERRTGR